MDSVESPGEKKVTFDEPEENDSIIIDTDNCEKKNIESFEDSKVNGFNTSKNFSNDFNRFSEDAVIYSYNNSSKSSNDLSEIKRNRSYSVNVRTQTEDTIILKQYTDKKNKKKANSIFYSKKNKAAKNFNKKRGDSIDTFSNILGDRVENRLKKHMSLKWNLFEDFDINGDFEPKNLPSYCGFDECSSGQNSSHYQNTPEKTCEIENIKQEEKARNKKSTINDSQLYKKT